jgi:hypothetical protein
MITMAITDTDLNSFYDRRTPKPSPLMVFHLTEMGADPRRHDQPSPLARMVGITRTGPVEVGGIPGQPLARTFRYKCLSLFPN